MISARIYKWYENMLNKAAHLGQLSDMESYKIGAILVFRKSIIATGYNKKKSHPLQQRYNFLRQEHKRNRNYIHAEVDCLNKLDFIPKDSILFIGRFDKNGKKALCRPCEACLRIISFHNIEQIVYNTNGGWAIEHLEKGDVYESH